MHMYVHTRVYVWCIYIICIWTYAYIYVCIYRGQRTILGTLLSFSPPYILRQGFWLKLGLTDWLAWLASVLQDSSISTPKALGLQTCASPCPIFIWMRGFTPRSSSLCSWRFIKGIFPGPSIPSHWPHYLNIETIFSFIFHWLKNITVYLFYALVVVNNDAMNGSWKGCRCHIDILSSYSFHRYQMWVAGSCEVLLKFQNISSGIFSKDVYFSWMEIVSRAWGWSIQIELI